MDECAINVGLDFFQHVVIVDRMRPKGQTQKCGFQFNRSLSVFDVSE